MPKATRMRGSGWKHKHHMSLGFCPRLGEWWEAVGNTSIAWVFGLLLSRPVLREKMAGNSSPFSPSTALRVQISVQIRKHSRWNLTSKSIPWPEPGRQLHGRHDRRHVKLKSCGPLDRLLSHAVSAKLCNKNNVPILYVTKVGAIYDHTRQPAWSVFNLP